MHAKAKTRRRQTACAECRVIRTLRTLHPAEQPRRRGGTCACSGTRAKRPSCSRCPCPGGARERARRDRACCCRSTADVDHSQHEGRAAAILHRVHEARHAYAMRISG
eukprot:scaffold1518_cov109-Isochrysis_galbana.AAC.7